MNLQRSGIIQKRTFSKSNIYEFSQVLEMVQNFISSKYSMLLKNIDDNKEYQIKSYIKNYISENKIAVEGLSDEDLVSKLYRDMAQYSFLTPFLNGSRTDVEEININAWNDTKITYSNGDILPSEENFLSPDHAIDVVRRLLRQSHMILDSSNPIVRGHLGTNIRVTVLGKGVIDDDTGVVASIRLVNPQKLGREDFIKKETLTEDMMFDLETLFRYGVSMCITGATGGGKTTLMEYLLSTIGNSKRIFTIENNTREFNLVKKDEKGKIINNVIHTVTRYSEDESKNIDQEKLLETALTSNPDYICVAEMKGSESFAAQEAARTGHTVITTTHANSCDATYPRMVTLCKTKYDMADKTLYELVTEAFPIVLFIKKLEDNSRKVMEIKECIIHEDGTREKSTLYKYEMYESKLVDGKYQITGKFKKVNNISEGLKKRLLENGMTISELERLVK